MELRRVAEAERSLRHLDFRLRCLVICKYLRMGSCGRDLSTGFAIFACLTALFGAGGCCIFTHYEPARLYKPGYEPGFSPMLHTSGFYSKVGGSWIPGMDERAKASTLPLFFYDDGSFCLGMSYPNIDRLRNSMPDAWVCWGFYSVTGTDIRIETIILNEQACCTEISEWEGRLETDGLLIDRAIDVRSGKREPWFEGRYIFMNFPERPSSDRNWIRTDRHYRISSVGLR